MVAVQAVIHIDAVAVEMEVRGSGLAVRMKRDDVLGLWEAAWRPVASLLSGQPDPVESLDEILFNPVNCFYRVRTQPQNRQMTKRNHAK